MTRTMLLSLCAALPLAVLGLLSTSRAAVQGEGWTQQELEALSRKLQADVEELRGEEFRRDVAVKLASKTDLVDYMKRRLQDEEPPEKLAADETIAKLLGLFPHDRDLMADTFALIESQVGGFYDPPSDTFYLMEGMPRGLAPAILSHELIHALDDQIYDLDRLLKERISSTDAAQAYRFLAEGSGQAGGTEWLKRHAAEIDVSALGDMQKQQEDLLRAPPYLWKPLLGAYLQGAAFVTRSRSPAAALQAAFDPQDVRRAFESPPRSTEQALHPQKYWDPAQRDEPRAVAFEVGELPRGWRELRQDTLGELGLAQVVEAGRAAQFDLAAMLSISFTNAASQGWGGDRVILLGDDESWWLVLATVWDSERDAAEFYGALTVQVPAIEAAAKGLQRRNSDVELRYGDAPDQVVLRVRCGVKRSAAEALESALRFSVR